MHTRCAAAAALFVLLARFSFFPFPIGVCDGFCCSAAPFRDPHCCAHWLAGYDWRSKYVVLALVAIQLFVATRVQHWSWTWILVVSYVMSQCSPQFVLMIYEFFFFLFIFFSYVVGGTVTQSLTLAIHELSHNLMFKFVANGCLAIVLANFFFLFFSLLSCFYHRQICGCQSIFFHVCQLATSVCLCRFV